MASGKEIVPFERAWTGGLDIFDPKRFACRIENEEESLSRFKSSESKLALVELPKVYHCFDSIHWGIILISFVRIACGRSFKSVNYVFMIRSIVRVGKHSFFRF